VAGTAPGAREALELEIGRVSDRNRPERTKVVIADVVAGTLRTPLSSLLHSDGNWDTYDVVVRRDGMPLSLVHVAAATPADEAERLVLDTLTRLTPPAPPWEDLHPQNWPAVRVAIPTTFSRVDDLERAVRSVSRLRYPAFDIVVVDNRPVPDRQDYDRIAGASDRAVSILHEPRAGISAARNRAFSSCPHDLIAYTDDDSMVEPNWLEALVRPLLVSEAVACSSGLVLPVDICSPEQALFERLFEGFNRSFVPRSYPAMAAGDPLFPYAPGRLGTGANMAFRVRWLHQIGGFDVSLGTGTPSRGGEDLAAFVRIILHGGSAAIEPAAIVWHDFRPTADQLKRQVYGYGVGLGAMCLALMIAEPRARRDIVRLFPRAAWMYLRSGNCTVRSAEDGEPAPRAWRMRHAAGMLSGPALYLESRYRSRRVA